MSPRLRSFNKRRSLKRWQERRRRRSVLQSDIESLPSITLESIEGRFYALIMKRAGHLKSMESLELPKLSALTAATSFGGSLRVPGMYGGFLYSLEKNGRSIVLIVNSFCRVVGGSAQRHLITPEMTKILCSGFDI